MNKKTIVGISVVCFIAIGISDSMPSDKAAADGKVYTQSVESYKNKILDPYLNFNRGQYEIIETKPWLKKENQQLRLSEQELRSILNKVGFTGKNLEMAMAIVYYESRLRPYALNKSSNCYGLFQINMTGSMGKARRDKYGLSKNEDLFNPIINASIAYKMSAGGKNWSAWTTERMAKASTN